MLSVRHCFFLLKILDCVYSAPFGHIRVQTSTFFDIVAHTNNIENSLTDHHVINVLSFSLGGVGKGEGVFFGLSCQTLLMLKVSMRN